MKSVATIAATALLLASPATAFSTSSSFSGSQLAQTQTNNAALTMEYIPSGMSKEQWKKIKEKDNKNKGKNLGKVGITSFQSRTFAEWQKAGGKNLFPVDPNKVKSASEIPYMQRQGGKPDDSDLKKGRGGKKKGAGAKAAEPEPKKKNWWTL